MTARNRILFYLFLALICYTLAVALSMTAAVILFVIIGVVAELLFWISLFNKLQNKVDPE